MRRMYWHPVLGPIFVVEVSAPRPMRTWFAGDKMVFGDIPLGVGVANMWDKAVVELISTYRMPKKEDK